MRPDHLPSQAADCFTQCERDRAQALPQGKPRGGLLSVATAWAYETGFAGGKRLIHGYRGRGSKFSRRSAAP